MEKDLPTFVYEFLKLGIDPSDIFFPNDEFFVGKTRYRKFIECLYKHEVVVCYIFENNKQNYLTFIYL